MLVTRVLANLEDSGAMEVEASAAPLALATVEAQARLGDAVAQPT